MDIKTVLKSSVAAVALLAIAAPTANAGIKNGNKNSLTVSGYMTKSLAHHDDGTESQLSVVDGQTENSRVRWIASGKLNENVSAGATLEMNIPTSNQAAGTSLGDNGEADTSGTAWGLRHEFVWVSHKKMGKLSLGQTNAAGNGSAQANLSGNAGTMDNKSFGQGVEFVDPIATGRSRSGVTVGAATSDFDLTSRTDVLRYDTPKFAGLGLAVSLNSGGGTEVGGSYSGKFGGVSVLAKAAYSNTSATQTTNDSIFAISGAVLHDSGLNAMVSYGTAELNNPAAGRDDPTNIYFGIGYKAKIFGTGGTNFTIKWNQTDDLTTQGNEGENLEIRAVQNFDAIGAFVGLSWSNYAYETTTNKSYDDVNVVALQTLFKF